MLFLSLLLTLSPPSKDAQCKGTFDALDTGLGIKKMMFAQMEQKYPDAGENITKKFIAKCTALADAEITCPIGKTGNALKECKGAMDALQQSVGAFMEEKDPGSFERFQLKSMQTEARANLKAMSTGLKSLYFEAADPKTFAFPASAPKSPAADCCKAPEKACVADAKTFAHPSFQTIGFTTEGKLRYAYEYTSKGKGPTAAFTIRASGDPQCKGKKESWTVTGTVKGTDLIVSEPTQDP